MAIDLIQKIDRDDLILIWSTSVSEITASLGPPARLARIQLATPRETAQPSGEKGPAAELDLLAYIEPEPGCP